MNTDKKLNTARTVFGVAVFILGAVIPLNLTLCGDTVLFMIFLAAGITASCWSFSVFKPAIAVTSVILGTVVAMALQPSAFSLVCSLLSLPFGIAFSIVKKNKLSRGTAISIGAGAATLLLIAYFLLNTLVTQGSVTPSSILIAYEGFFDGIREAICSSATITVAGKTVALVTPSGADKYLHTIVALIPGVIYVTISMTAYFSAWLFKRLRKTFNYGNDHFKEWKLSPSPVTSVLFLTVMALSTVLNGADPLSYTVLNVALILSPILFMSGLNSAFESRIINGIRLPRLLRPALLIISLLIGTAAFVAVCLIFGVYDSVKTVLPKRKPSGDQG
jgi:hypothetical protein